MKFLADRIEGVNAITDLGERTVTVNGTAYQSSIVIPWTGDVVAWDPAHFDQLTAEHFARLADLQPELVIFGSGPSLRFPAPTLWRTLIERRIGFEAMDTRAACRTYNVLASQARSVVAALLMDTSV